MKPRHWTWGLFVKGKKKFGNNKTQYQTFCVACVAHFLRTLEHADQQAVADGGSIALVRDKGEIYKEACQLAKPICGRPADFRRHIRVCPHMPEEAKEQLQAEEAAANEADGAGQPVHPIPSTATHPQAGLVHHPKTQPIALTHSEQQGFHLDLLHLFAANNFPLHAIGLPQTRKFCRTWLPGLQLLTQQALGGRILQAAVKGSKDRIKAAVGGKMGTGISDGWTSHRRALLACMVNVDYEAHTVKVVDISALPKTADEHLKVVESAIEYCTKHLGVDIIGWVSNAGGESRAMRVWLGRKNPHLIILDCYAHQVNLILSDLFKLKIELIDAGSDAQLVVKWFLSHTQALALLQGQQTKAGGRAHRYTLANLTRWTTHYHSIQSLVDDQGPMQATVALYRKELEQIGSRKPAVTAKVLNTVCQPDFWAKIAELVTYLRPLAIAINITQAADTWLDHVLLTLANLYRLFDVHGIDPLVRQCILASLELRWSKADQQVFILAVFLNPYIRGLLFNPHNPAFCVNGLYTIVKRVFEHVFKVSADSGLCEGLVDYFHWRNEFSRKVWHLEEYATMYRHENKPVNLVALWSSLPYPGSTNTGRNQLACLAKCLLSVVANSAGAERLFSRMGNIHSKHRNRMHYDKVHDLATVAMDLEAQHQAAGHVHKRARRQLNSTSAQPTTTLNAVGSVDDAEPNSNPSDLGSEASDDEAADNKALVDFKTLAARLAEVVDDDEDELDVSAEANGLPAADDLVAQLAQQPRVRLFFGTARPILLRELFNFSDAVEGVEDGLGVFWKGGIVNLGKEREIFEAISSEHVVNKAN